MISLLKYTLGITFFNVFLTNNDVVIPLLGQANDTKGNCSINKPCGLNQLLEKVSDSVALFILKLSCHHSFLISCLPSQSLSAFLM